MIVTLTLNPALDKIIQMENDIDPGNINRQEKMIVRAGGKGLNVARIVNKLNRSVLAISPVGGFPGKRIEKILQEEGTPAKLTSNKYETRENIKLIEKSGRETEINQFGQLDRENYDKLVNVLIKHLEKADILVLAGSVPDGLSKDIYSELLTLSRKHKVKTILDTSGKALKEGIKGKPFLIKPNLKELEELSERKLNDIAEIKKAVKKLINLGLENIVVSLGEKGAVFASKDQLYHVIPPQVKMADTTVGAGDTMVAGISIALKEKFTFQKMASYATSLATLFVSGVPITENHIKRIERELKIIDGGGLE